MSSDPVLRERVHQILQNVIDQRKYGQGLGYGGSTWTKFLKEKKYKPCYKKYLKPKKKAKRKGGDMYDGVYGDALVGGYPVGGIVVGGAKKKKKRGPPRNMCWINFVKNYAKSHGKTYGESLKLAKTPYRKQYGGLNNLY